MDWGVDEIFAELFAGMGCASVYDGNPAGELVAIIGGEEYGPRDTLATIGLYGGWYNVDFRPGDLVHATL